MSLDIFAGYMVTGCIGVHCIARSCVTSCMRYRSVQIAPPVTAEYHLASIFVPFHTISLKNT